MARSTLSFPLRRLALALGVTALVAAGAAHANEAVIRATLGKRLPNLPKIDEVRPMPMLGLWEVRIGHDVFYTDAAGAWLVQGNIIDTATRTDVTQQRLDKLAEVPFDALPLKDAVVVKQGNGKRRVAVFADPNCGYCKHLERDLVTLKDVTIYTFLYPILGADSQAKSRDIWCAKESGKTWREWMVEGDAPTKHMGAGCDTAALTRNVELGRRLRVNGTPAMVFEDGTRAAGALPAAQVEQRLAAAAKKG